MPIDTFFIYTIILYLPGIIWGFADLYFGRDRNMKMLVLLFKVHVFGIITYTLTIDSINLAGMLFNFNTTLQNPLFKFGTDFKPEYYENEIRLAFFTSLIFSLIWIYNIKYKVLWKVLTKINALEPEPITDIISMMIRTNELGIRRIRYHDLENNRTYTGIIDGSDEKNQILTVILSQVKIYDSGGNCIDEATKYSISRKIGNFDIQLLTTKE